MIDEDSQKIMPRPGNQPSLIEFFSYLFDRMDLFAFRFTYLMDFIGYMLQNDASERQLLSDRVARCVSDLSIISECIRQLDLYQPWISQIEDEQRHTVAEAFVKSRPAQHKKYFFARRDFGYPSGSPKMAISDILLISEGLG